MSDVEKTYEGMKTLIGKPGELRGKTTAADIRERATALRAACWRERERMEMNGVECPPGAFDPVKSIQTLSEDVARLALLLEAIYDG